MALTAPEKWIAGRDEIGRQLNLSRLHWYVRMISHVAMLCACLSDVGGIFTFEGTKTPRVPWLHMLNVAARRRLEFVRQLTTADFELFRLNIA